MKSYSKSKAKELVKDSHYYHERQCLGIRKTLEKKSQFQMDRLYERLMARKGGDDLNERLKQLKSAKKAARERNSQD